MTTSKPLGARSLVQEILFLLVGHSYGGTLITHAGTDPRVAGLVYLAALSLDSGETSHEIQAKFPTADVYSYIEMRFGRVWMQPDGIECFAGDLPEQEQKLIWATSEPVRGRFTRRNREGYRMEVEAELVHSLYQ